MASKGTTIIITSHILQTLTGLCTYIHYLKNGVIERTFDTLDPEMIDKAIFRELDAGIDKIIDDIL
jgi:ABC-2 type transport system ATP-binding protein